MDVEEVEMGEKEVRVRGSEKVCWGNVEVWDIGV